MSPGQTRRRVKIPGPPGQFRPRSSKAKCLARRAAARIAIERHLVLLLVQEHAPGWRWRGPFIQLNSAGPHLVANGIELVGQPELA